MSEAREAQLFVNTFLLLELFPAVDGQRDVMNGAGAKCPTAGRAIRLVVED